MPFEVTEGPTSADNVESRVVIFVVISEDNPDVEPSVTMFVECSVNVLFVLWTMVPSEVVTVVPFSDGVVVSFAFIVVVAKTVFAVPSAFDVVLSTVSTNMLFDVDILPSLYNAVDPFAVDVVITLSALEPSIGNSTFSVLVASVLLELVAFVLTNVIPSDDVVVPSETVDIFVSSVYGSVGITHVVTFVLSDLTTSVVDTVPVVPRESTAVVPSVFIIVVLSVILVIEGLFVMSVSF